MKILWHLSYIYIYKSANALNHCSYSALVSWATFFFFQSFESNYSAKWHCSYNSYSFFFFFFFFFLLNIYVNWYIYCYTDTINFTIFSQLLTCANVLKHCSYSTLVSWAFFFPNFWTISGTVAIVATIFFFLVIGLCFFFF